MGVSRMVYNGTSFWNGWFKGYPLFRKTSHISIVVNEFYSDAYQTGQQYIVIENGNMKLLEMHNRRNAQFKTMTIPVLVTLVATFFLCTLVSKAALQRPRTPSRPGPLVQKWEALPTKAVESSGSRIIRSQATRWCPPSYKLVYNPTNYRYIYHKS